jgi:serine/threonine protein kinase
MRAIAQLQHPNIVAAMDAGEAVDPNPEGPVLHYLVMEYVPGQDLEALVKDRGTVAARAGLRSGSPGGRRPGRSS